MFNTQMLKTMSCKELPINFKQTLKEELIETQEVASLLGIHYASVNRLVKLNQLPAIRIGGKNLFIKSEILKHKEMEGAR